MATPTKQKRFQWNKGLVKKYRGGGGGGVGRSISKCGGKKSHDPPLPIGAKRCDPPLNEG